MPFPQSMQQVCRISMPELSFAAFTPQAFAQMQPRSPVFLQVVCAAFQGSHAERSDVQAASRGYTRLSQAVGKYSTASPPCTALAWLVFHAQLRHGFSSMHSSSIASPPRTVLPELGLKGLFPPLPTRVILIFPARGGLPHAGQRPVVHGTGKIIFAMSEFGATFSNHEFCSKWSSCYRERGYVNMSCLSH